MTPDAVEGPLAPELIHATIASDVEFGPADVFAFSMLAYEVLTGKPPFDGQSRTTAALLIFRGERPDFPQNAGLTAQMQDLLRRCWHHNPMERPTIGEVVETLELFDKIKCVQRSPSEYNSHPSAFLTLLSAQGTPNHESRIARRPSPDRGCPSAAQETE